MDLVQRYEILNPLYGCLALLKLAAEHLGLAVLKK